MHVRKFDSFTLEKNNDNNHNNNDHYNLVATTIKSQQEYKNLCEELKGKEGVI
jgi:hypothetical protein